MDETMAIGFESLRLSAFINNGSNSFGFSGYVKSSGT